VSVNYNAHSLTPVARLVQGPWTLFTFLEKCFQFDSILAYPILALVKTIPLTVRQCPEDLHKALKKSAVINRRSLNKEALTWLDAQAKRKPRLVTGREAARILREAQKLLTPQEHRQFGEDIETYLKKVRLERLH